MDDTERGIVHLVSSLAIRIPIRGSGTATAFATGEITAGTANIRSGIGFDKAPALVYVYLAKVPA
jgi:hypothetical protein